MRRVVSAERRANEVEHLVEQHERRRAGHREHAAESVFQPGGVGSAPSRTNRPVPPRPPLVGVGVGDGTDAMADSHPYSLGAHGSTGENHSPVEPLGSPVEPFRIAFAAAAGTTCHPRSPVRGSTARSVRTTRPGRSWNARSISLLVRFFRAAPNAKRFLSSTVRTG